MGLAKSASLRFSYGQPTANRHRRRAILLLAACSSTASASPPQSSSAGSTTVLPVVALPRCSLSVFTEPNSSESATPPLAPDSEAIDQNHVFIDYQNKTAEDCTIATTTHSTVSEYLKDG